MIILCCRKYEPSRIATFPHLCFCPSSLADHALIGKGRPVFYLVETDSELHNLPLVGCYHIKPVLQIPPGLCGAQMANPCFATDFV